MKVEKERMKTEDSSRIIREKEGKKMNVETEQKQEFEKKEKVRISYLEWFCQSKV